MKLEIQEITTRKIVNVHKHVDGPWFWGKYTAHPYIGCRSGCEFCYLRGARYLGRRDPNSFDTLVQVKTNAVSLLRKEITRLEPDVISVGDWQQPVEDDRLLSRQMLEVVLEVGFPLFIVERSPLLVRDVDLLTEINRRSWVGVLYSITSLEPGVKRIFESRSPGVRRRLQALEQLAQAGIQAGVSMMPILPGASDDEDQLEEVIKATRDHGGICVLAGGLTMDGSQAERTLAAAERFDPALPERWRKLYRWAEGGKPAYGPSPAYNAQLGLRVRELCNRHGLLDRLPRYIAPGPLAANKSVAERLFLKTYDLELERASFYRIWAYRKAAWAVDEYPEPIDQIHQRGGTVGLQRIPGIGGSISREIGGWLSRLDREEVKTSQGDQYT